MIPPLIVEYALEAGLDLIAITDHNSTANIAAVQKAAEGTTLIVLPGMELQTREDVHSICLFDTLEQAIRFQSIVSAALPSKTNQPDFFGEQFIVDETGEFIKREEQLLITAASLSLNEAFKEVTDLGGLFIPAHINRKTFGLIETLGFVPFDIPFRALEISRHITPEIARTTLMGVGQIPFIQNGDVHRLSEFLGTLHLQMESPCIAEIQMALRRENGRNYQIYQ